MGKKYSKTFKNRAIEKALTRTDGVSILQVANDMGVARGTLYDWLLKSSKQVTSNHNLRENRPQDWRVSEKLEAIIETSTLNAEKLNFYCRRNGIYKHHIEQWKADMANTKSNPDKAEICDVLGVALRTWQRWKISKNTEDSRIYNNSIPANKLSEIEIQRILKISNEERFANLPPKKIVPMLADEGIYLASESSFYRILKAANQMKHRNKSRVARKVIKPKALVAHAPNQAYSWEGLPFGYITYLPTNVRGIFLYLYLVMDVYSRKIVGWQIHESESAEFAADLMVDICAREGIIRGQVTLHSDNGSLMKGATMLATLQKLGVIPSFSRPAVSNDNPYYESIFKTLKYHHQYPCKPFQSLKQARNWVVGFVRWYNYEHLHSAISFVTPNQRHLGDDVAILKNRDDVYLKAQSLNPKRWSGKTRNWQHISSVSLNPDKNKDHNNLNIAA